MKKVIVNGKEYSYDEVVDMMNDEIRESLHTKLAPCNEQDFVDAYVKIDPNFLEGY